MFDVNVEDGRGKTFFQVDDIRKMMGVSKATAYALVKRKDFPCIKVGNRLVIPSNLFDEWVAKTATSGRC